MNANNSVWDFFKFKKTDSPNPIEDKICPVCNISHNRKGIYCSDKCRIKAFRTKRREKLLGLCKYCGEPIPMTKKTNSKFCCAKHKDNHHRRLRSEKILENKANCKNCGQKITDKNYYTFCGRECSDSYYNKPRRLRTKKDVEKTCPTCNEIHNRKGIYCSKKCKDDMYNKRKKEKAIALREKEVRFCKYCNEPIPITKKINVKFCCDEHKVKYFVNIKKRNREKFNKQDRDRRRKKWLEKKLRCLYCGESIPLSSWKSKNFCSKEHSVKFFRLKRSNKPILIRINDRTFIPTKNYDKIQEIRERYEKRVNIYDKEMFSNEKLLEEYVFKDGEI